jgi:hypothetical protein
VAARGWMQAKALLVGAYQMLSSCDKTTAADAKRAFKMPIPAATYKRIIERSKITE